MYSTGSPEGLTGLAAVEAVVEFVLAQDTSRMSHAARADHLRALGQLIDLLEGTWLQMLAEVDRRGAAGADRGEGAASTADWLCDRLGVSADLANSWVRRARTLHRRP